MFLGIIHLGKPQNVKKTYNHCSKHHPGIVDSTGSETQIDANQVIIRYLRFRRWFGPTNKGTR